jgi:hypothetical protein
LGLGIGIRTYHRQANAQVFWEYTGRCEKIMESFPPESLSTRLSLAGEPPTQSQRLSLAVIRYFDLCSEEFYLCKKGYLSKNVWRIWETELSRMLKSPLLMREWKQLQQEFQSYQEFRNFVEMIQSQDGKQ